MRTASTPWPKITVHGPPPSLGYFSGRPPSLRRGHQASRLDRTCQWPDPRGELTGSTGRLGRISAGNSGHHVVQKAAAKPARLSEGERDLFNSGAAIWPPPCWALQNPTTALFSRERKASEYTEDGGSQQVCASCLSEAPLDLAETGRGNMGSVLRSRNLLGVPVAACRCRTLYPFTQLRRSSFFSVL